MKKAMALVAASVLTATLAGCQGVSNQDVGVVTGGVLGGVLGNQIGGGTGRIIATVGGAALGAYLGGRIGQSMDEVDRMKMNSALESTPSNRTTNWSNPDTGANYAVTPTKTYYSNGLPCRDYTTVANIGGKRQTVYGRACRQADGSWQAVN